MAGAINPTPDISVVFKTLATTAIQRSELGILYIVLKDETSTEKFTTITTIADINTKKWSEKSQKLIQLAMQTYSPKKIVVVRQEAEEDINTILGTFKSRKMNWLACPNAENEEDGK